MIEEGVTAIGASVFDSASTTAIFLPGSLTEIDRSAFAGCSALLNVQKGSAVEKFCETYDIPHQNTGELSEIIFIGVRNGDAIPMSRYQLLWKAVPGATEYYLQMYCDGKTRTLYPSTSAAAPSSRRTWNG